MTRPFPAGATILAIALLAVGPASQASAQGTAAQREACAPDAIRLCQDTIPDVAKTTACMKAHQSELSSSCRRMFVAATSDPSPAARTGRRTARTAPPAPAVVAEPSLDQLDLGSLNVPLSDESDTPASRAADARQARRVVARLCRGAILDPGTCRLTQSAIDLAR